MQDLSTAVLFDLDGVLVDSRAPISSSLAHALQAHGFPCPSLGSLERFIGPPLTSAFAELTGHPPDSPRVLACLESYRDRYREASLNETKVFPGIPETLAILTQSHRLAVATSKPLVLAEPLLTALGLRSRFEHVAGPALDAHHEDKQTTIRRVLSALDSTRAVMIGDTHFDIAGAHACGIPALGVSWGIGTRDELASRDADRIVDSPEELPEAINDLLARA